METAAVVWTDSEDHAIAALYQAASGQLAWHGALSVASQLFSAARAQLALLPHAGAEPCVLADVRLEGSFSDAAVVLLPPAPPALLAPGAGASGAVLSVPLDAGSLALAAFRWGSGQKCNAGLAPALRRWAGHLRVALQSARRHEQARRQGQLAQTLLDALPHASWILGAQLELLLCNSRAAEWVQRADSNVRLREGRFGIRQPATDQAFSNLVRALAASAPGASAVLDIRGDRTQPPQLLHVRREDGSACHHWPSGQLVVSLFDPRQAATEVSRDVSHALGLTAAEGRVACLLARGHGPEDIAELQGTCISTVRTQLAQVFRKLGLARQTDVVRVLSQHQSLWRLMGK